MGYTAFKAWGKVLGIIYILNLCPITFLNSACAGEKVIQDSTLLLGLGYENNRYQQQGTSGNSEKALQLRGRFQVWHSIFEFGAEGSATGIPFQSSTPNVNMRVYQGIADAGFRVLLGDPTLSLSALAGYHFETMSVTDDQFGFENDAGPLAEIILRKHFSEDHFLQARFQYAPIAQSSNATEGSIGSNRGISGQIDWILEGTNGRAYWLWVNYSSTNLVIRNVPVQIQGLSLGFGFGI